MLYKYDKESANNYAGLEIGDGLIIVFGTYQNNPVVKLSTTATIDRFDKQLSLPELIEFILENNLLSVVPIQKLIEWKLEL